MTEQEPQSQAWAIKERRGAERARILIELFETPLRAAEVAAKVVATTLASDNVKRDAKQSAFMGEGQAAASAIREEAKVRWLESELLEQSELTALAEHLEEFLAPDSVSAADVASVSQLSEEALISSADSVGAMPNNENILKTFLAVARQKGYEMAVHHIVSLEPGGEFEMALVDLQICQESIEKSEEEIANEFWGFAKDGPDGPAILAAAQSDLNLMSLLR